MDRKSEHSPLELALRYAAAREAKSIDAELAEARPTVVQIRSSATRTIDAATLAALRMESARSAWVDGIREAA